MLRVVAVRHLRRAVGGDHAMMLALRAKSAYIPGFWAQFSRIAKLALFILHYEYCNTIITSIQVDLVSYSHNCIIIIYEYLYVFVVVALCLSHLIHVPVQLGEYTLPPSS